VINSKGLDRKPSRSSSDTSSAFAGNDRGKQRGLRIASSPPEIDSKLVPPEYKLTGSCHPCETSQD
jgi:hypothetical protein